MIVPYMDRQTATYECQGVRGRTNKGGHLVDKWKVYPGNCSPFCFEEWKEERNVIKLVKDYVS